MTSALPTTLGRHPDGPLGRVVWTKRDVVKAVAASHGVTNVRLFGSVARGEDTADSDVDLLVDLPAGMGLFGLGRATHALEQVLGVRVDLVPASDLKPGVRDEVEAQALPL